MTSRAGTTFGALAAHQLNWRQDESRWSVAQCLQHLMTSNNLMLQASQSALSSPASSIWQRIPALPGFFGRALIRSQSPTATRKYNSPRKSTPAASDIPADIVERFVAQHRDLTEWMKTVDERRAARAIMISPFIGFITYSVLDGCRLLAAHDRRHLEQARRVTETAGFPEL